MANVALRSAVLDQRLVGVTNHIDEARCDRQPFDVDFPRALGVREVSDRRDGVALDGNVTDVRRLAASVVDRAVAEDEVVWDRRAAGGGKE